MKKEKIYIVGFILLLCDQMIKFIVGKTMILFQSISVIPHFFQIQYIQNKGAAWGILQDQTFILTIVGALAVILLNQYLIKEKKFNCLSIFGYGLLMGGMIGNLVDRIIHGYVIDYLSFRILGYDFPVFNLADMGIVIGIMLLIIEIIRGEVNEYRCRKR